MVTGSLFKIEQKERARFTLGGADIVDRHRPQGAHSVNTLGLVNNVVSLELSTRKSRIGQWLNLHCATVSGGLPGERSVKTPASAPASGHDFDTTVLLWSFDPEKFNTFGGSGIDEGPFEVQAGIDWTYDGRIITPHSMGLLTVYFTYPEATTA